MFIKGALNEMNFMMEYRASVTGPEAYNSLLSTLVERMLFLKNLTSIRENGTRPGHLS